MKGYKAFTIWIATFVIIGAFSSCHLTKKAQVANTELIGTSWTLLEYGRPATGCNGQTYLSLSFSKKSANGFSGCNNFFGEYTVDKDRKLKFGPLASTMMACMDNGCNRREVDYIRKLNSITNYQMEGNTLKLFAAKTLLLVYTKAAKP